MSFRKTLYFAAVIMTLVPLLFSIAVQNSGFNNRIIAEHKSEFMSFSRTGGEILMQTSQNVYAQIWLSMRHLLNTDNLRETLESPEGAEYFSNQLNDTVYSIGTSGKGANKIADIFILDKSGSILASSNAELLGLDIAGTPLFEILTDKDKTSSPFMQSDFHSGDYGVWLTRHLENDLFLSAFLSSDVFSLNHFEFNNTGFYAVVNWQGIIISHPDAELIGTVIDNKDIVSALSSFSNNPNASRSGSGTGEFFGQDHVYGYYIFNDFGGAVFIFQQVDEVLSLKSTFLRDGIIITLLIGAFVLLIFLPLLHTRIIKPIMNLRKSINLVKHEQYEICEVKYNDEIGDLVSGFNSMVTQIKAHIDDLEHKNEVLREMEEWLELDRERLKVSEQRFKCAADISTIAIFELVPYTNEYFATDSWDRITTYKHGDIYPLEYVLHNIIHPDYRAKLIDWVDNLTGNYSEDLKIFTVDGTTKWVHVSMAVVDDPTTGNKKISGTLTDINERKVAQEFSDYLAYHEPLTGLPRRNMFCSNVSEKLSMIKNGNRGLIITINIANIRRINDTFGFSIGERVIVIIAEALKKNFGTSMSYARNTGDSYLIYTETTSEADHINNLCERILNIFSRPLLVNNMSVAVDIRMGASIYPIHGYHIEELVQYADIAMIEAWFSRGTDFAVFDPVMIAKVRRTHQIMQILQEYDENKYLYLVYQPIVDTNKKCLGFEALVRLDITSIGFISPAEFIPLAEDARLIIPIGMDILRSACLKSLSLFNKGYEFGYMSVNVSPVQLEESNFVEMVLDILRETGLPPEKLQLEVTESIMLSNIETACEKLALLRVHGVKIALDDFGTGYSSMKYLREIPLDVLKIDKHFIDEIENDKQQIFAFTMIQMAHELGLKVVAEGVETKTQFDILKDRGCDCMQGYLISRPLKEDVVADFIKGH